MKNLKITLVVLAVSLATTFSATANNTNPSNSKKELRTKIMNLIGKNIPVQVKNECIDAEVSFVLNDKNEIVVVSVSSKHGAIDGFIKNRLNYRKVVVNGIKKGEIYKLPLRVQKPS